MPQKASKNQTKTNQNGKKYLEYEAMGKEDCLKCSVLDSLAVSTPLAIITRNKASLLLF